MLRASDRIDIRLAPNGASPDSACGGGGTQPIIDSRPVAPELVEEGTEQDQAGLTPTSRIGHPVTPVFDIVRGHEIFQVSKAREHGLYQVCWESRGSDKGVDKYYHYVGDLAIAGPELGLVVSALEALSFGLTIFGYFPEPVSATQRIRVTESECGAATTTMTEALSYFGLPSAQRTAGNESTSVWHGTKFVTQ